MKAYKTYKKALIEAGGRPVLELSVSKDRLYVVVDEPLGEATLISTKPGPGHGAITGHITMRQLDRLGNANWCEPSARWEIKGSAFGLEVQLAAKDNGL